MILSVKILEKSKVTQLNLIDSLDTLISNRRGYQIVRVDRKKWERRRNEKGLRFEINKSDDKDAMNGPF